MSTLMKQRFRGFLPVVVDIETGGFDDKRHAILEIAAVLLRFDERHHLVAEQTVHCHVEPFEGSDMDREALEFTGIDPYHPFRFAISEEQALQKIFQPIFEALNEHNCQRAVLVGHNPKFDLNFIQAAIKRTKAKNPFHKFTTFDTATLGGVALGQTVLAKACRKANIKFETDKAHSALYDAKKTADLFCHIVNQWPHPK